MLFGVTHTIDGRSRRQFSGQRPQSSGRTWENHTTYFSLPRRAQCALGLALADTLPVPLITMSQETRPENAAVWLKLTTHLSLGHQNKSFHSYTHHYLSSLDVQATHVIHYHQDIFFKGFCTSITQHKCPLLAKLPQLSIMISGILQLASTKYPLNLFQISFTSRSH